MRKNSISNRILRLFAITMLGTCAFAVAEGNYKQDQPSAPQSKQDRQQQSSTGQKRQESYQREPDGSERSMSRTARDAWIQGKLEATFAYNSELSSFAIDTEVKNGVVNLKGNVESETAKDLAEQLAMDVEGVDRVRNNLRVVPDADSQG